MTTTTLHGHTAPSTRADQRRAMGGAAERDRRHQAAYEAGLHGVSEDEHFAGRDDVDQAERDAYQTGAAEKRRARRHQAAATTRRHARSVAATSGGYLARTGRSLTDTAAGGGGSVAGIFVGILMVILLYLLLTRAGLATSLVNGVTRGLVWFVSPSVLPF